MSETCGARCQSGIGIPLVCAKPVGHPSNHEDRWRDRDQQITYTRFTDEDVARFPANA